MSWTDDYRPKTTENLVGQDSVIEKVKDFIKNYKSQKQKAVLICGPPGSGKTSTAYAVANELNLEVFEVNASDVRNKSSIEDTVGKACLQMSLFMTSKLIVLDEIDGLSGTKDRGGASAMAKIIKQSVFPVILIANDGYSDKLKELRKISLVLDYEPVNYIEIKKVFISILDAKNIEYDEDALSDLARRSGGDLRSAINDLESLAAIHKKITKETIDTVDSRDKQDTIQNALFKVFKTKDIDTSKSSYDKLPMNYDEIMLWLDYNIPKEYKDIDDIYRAYDALSKADIYKARIMRRQDWRYLVYVYFYMSVGISLAKKEKYKGAVTYQRTTRLLKIWQANMSQAKKRAFSKRMQEFFHTNHKRVMNEIFPFIKQYVIDQDLKQLMTKEFELTDDEIKLLEK